MLCTILAIRVFLELWHYYYSIRGFIRNCGIMSAMYIHVAVDLFSELDYHALVVSLCSIIIIITYSHDNNIILCILYHLCITVYHIM